MSTLLAILRVLGTDCTEEFNEVRQPEHVIPKQPAGRKCWQWRSDAAWLLTWGAAQPLDQEWCSMPLALKSLPCILFWSVANGQQDGSSGAPRLLCPLSFVWQPKRKHQAALLCMLCCLPLDLTVSPHVLMSVAPDNCIPCLPCLQVHEPRIRAQLKPYYIGDLQQPAETATISTQ